MNLFQPRGRRLHLPEPKHVAAKYLVPETIFLIVFQIFPVLYTMSTAFTNFGDGHRGYKAEAIVAVQAGSVEQVPGSPEYQLTLAAKDGDLVFLLTDPITKAVQAGTAEGLSPVDGAELSISGNFLGVLIWNVVFALGSVLGQFVLGLLAAIVLHSPKVKGTRIYRTLLILPFAMPSFAMLLVWRDMFNTDFGLVNGLLGGHTDWIGQENTARLALTSS